MEELPIFCCTAAQTFSGDFVLTNVLNDVKLFKKLKVWENDEFSYNLDENELKKLSTNLKSFRFKLRVVSLEDNYFEIFDIYEL